jgi:hydroxypyruvate isomerase
MIFAANVSILYPNQPFLERLETVARAGFGAVEFWWPSDAIAEGLTLDALVERVRELSLRVVLFNFDAGNMAAGDRGLGSDTASIARFREHVPVAVELASRLGCRKLNLLAGNAVDGVRREDQLSLLAESLAFAAEAAAPAGAAIMLEAINGVDAPAYLLQSTEDVLAMIGRVGSRNVFFQLDTYHLGVAGEDIVASVGRASTRIGHVQFADVPGRHEPGTGSLSFRAILDGLAEVPYADAVGLEFVPANSAGPDFRFLADLESRPRLR